MKNFVANKHHSFTFVFTFSVVTVDLLTNCILSFLFLAETDVLVAVFSQSTDIVVVNFIVVLKFPNVAQWTLYQQNPCLPIAVENLSLVCRKGRSKEDLCYYTFDNHLCQYHHSWHESTFHRKGTVP